MTLLAWFRVYGPNKTLPDDDLQPALLRLDVKFITGRKITWVETSVTNLVWNKAHTYIETWLIKNRLIKRYKDFHGHFVSQQTAVRRETPGDMLERPPPLA